MDASAVALFLNDLVALDANALLATDIFRDQVFSIKLSDQTITALPGRYPAVNGLVLDAARRLVYQEGHQEVSVYERNASTGAITVSAVESTHGRSLLSVTADNSFIYTGWSVSGNNYVKRYNASTYAEGTVHFVGSGAGGYTLGMAVAAGKLYVTDRTVDLVKVFNTSLLTNTTFVLTGLAPATAYAITVKAKDAAGNLSAASAPLSVSTYAALAVSITSPADGTVYNQSIPVGTLRVNASVTGYSISKVHFPQQVGRVRAFARLGRSQLSGFPGNAYVGRQDYF